MIPADKFILLTFFLITVSTYRHQANFITFNTSSRATGLSASLSTNLLDPFTVYSPLLFSTKGSSVTFYPNVIEGKFQFNSPFPEDDSRLYNEYSNQEFWYAFKKQIDPEIIDTTATFAYAKVTVNEKSGNYVLPMFSLPLTFLNLDNLYRCDDLLISYLNTGSLIDVTIFSEKESWHLFPEALWGYRHKDQEINFSRQTYKLGTNIQVDVGPSKYCVLNDELPKNTYNLVEQNIYTLEDLFVKYSTSLELKNKQAQTNEQL